MKRFLVLFLAVVMCLSFTACKGKTSSEGGDADTAGKILLNDFKRADSSKSAQDIAEEISKNKIITFGPMIMPVEEGLLTGFGNTEIKGFKEGVMMAPMIGSIPFVSYVFTVDSNIDDFMKTLKNNADPRWNVCTEAEETIVEKSGNKVFFIMCKKDLNES